MHQPKLLVTFPAFIRNLIFITLAIPVATIFFLSLFLFLFLLIFISFALCFFNLRATICGGMKINLSVPLVMDEMGVGAPLPPLDAGCMAAVAFTVCCGWLRPVADGGGGAARSLSIYSDVWNSSNSWRVAGRGGITCIAPSKP